MNERFYIPRFPRATERQYIVSAAVGVHGSDFNTFNVQIMPRQSDVKQLATRKCHDTKNKASQPYKVTRAALFSSVAHHIFDASTSLHLSTRRRAFFFFFYEYVTRNNFPLFHNAARRRSVNLGNDKKRKQQNQRATDASCASKRIETKHGETKPSATRAT